LYDTNHTIDAVGSRRGDGGWVGRRFLARLGVQSQPRRDLASWRLIVAYRLAIVEKQS
jgi:hypothetical protein